MARIPDSELERLRSMVDLVRLIEADAGRTVRRTVPGRTVKNGSEERFQSDFLRGPIDADPAR